MVGTGSIMKRCRPSTPDIEWKRRPHAAPPRAPRLRVLDRVRVLFPFRLGLRPLDCLGSGPPAQRRTSPLPPPAGLAGETDETAARPDRNRVWLRLGSHSALADGEGEVPE